MENVCPYDYYPCDQLGLYYICIIYSIVHIVTFYETDS